MLFKCGHPRDEENALIYNAGRKTGISVRCRICYNKLRKEYQRMRYKKKLDPKHNPGLGDHSTT